MLGVQIELGLGHSFPVLYLTVEGLNAIGKLAPEEYEFYKNRYTEPLETVKPSLFSKATKPTEFVQTREAERKSLNNRFKSILEQWNKLSPKAQSYHLASASGHPTLKYAKLLLEIGGSENGKV